MIEGELYETGDSMNVQRSHQSDAVLGDRCGTQLQLGGDHFGWETFHQERQDLELTVRKPAHGRLVKIFMRRAGSI